MAKIVVGQNLANLSLFGIHMLGGTSLESYLASF